MTRLKIHHLREGGLAQSVIAERCEVSVRSVERISSEPTPTVAEVAAGVRSDATRPGRPSKADDKVRAKVLELLVSEPRILATEVLRRSRAWGYKGSRSAMSALVKELRPAPSKEPVVRFEGLPGEYAQFDHGEARVTYEDGSVEKVIFFAGRLKYSRFMHVELVPNFQSEAAMRALVACIEAFGGSPKEWVFDNARTLRASPIGVLPIQLHRYLRDLVAEYRVIPTFCAPRSGNQKGSVERLVGYAKHSFLFSRRFKNREDLQAQLGEWLREVNHERPCDATGVIPEVARQEELRWLKERPLITGPSELALRETATVTPTGTVSVNGTPYFATARLIGAPATIFIRQDTIEIAIGDRERCTHARRDGVGTVQRLESQRTHMLAAIHGETVRISV
jgi:transposase